MFDSVLPIIFSWPFVVFSVIASVVGILYEIPLLVVVGALTIVPFSYQLNNVQYFRGVALLLPVLQLFSAWALKEERNVWAWVLFAPTIAVILWLFVVNSISGFF